MNKKHKFTALIILDGFGIAPPNEGNAIALAKKPYFDHLIKNYPTTLLEASGINVGLPRGEFGNSEVGHMTLGSGLVRYQNLPRIDSSIKNGDFFKLPQLDKIKSKLAKNPEAKLHLMGLLGPGGVHSHQRHLEALIKWSRQEKLGDRVFLHLFTDGRDTDKQSALGFAKELIKFCKKNKAGEVASIGGRYYGMDRNRNWDRTEIAYQAIVNGESKNMAKDPVSVLKKSYANEVYDEEILPTAIVDKKNNPIATVDSGDAMIFFNFRADRSIQMSRALTKKDFHHFETKKLTDFELFTFTKYENNLDAEIFFSERKIELPLAKILSQQGLKQIHLAETEKYAHVTYFFNGRSKDVFDGEEWLLIPSPDVTTYDKQPEMSAQQLTQKIAQAIDAKKHDFMLINYANPDMVGHTGNLEATVKSVEYIDKCLKEVVTKIEKNGGQAFIVADHGNAEEMINLLTGRVDKEHNVYPVPFIGVGLEGSSKGNFDYKALALSQPSGTIADVAPTILDGFGIEIPKNMTGRGLF